MKHNLLAAALLLAPLGLTARAVAAPIPFAPPPTMPGLTETLHAVRPLALAAGAPPPACTPDGSVSRQGAVLSVRLVFKRGRFMINNPDPTDPQPNHWDPVELRSYGGCQSGPTMVVRPGDTLDVDLVNETDPNDPSCLPAPPPGLGVTPGVGCYNTTNLHLHGLHVSPTGNSDNVLLSIAPQTTFPYEVNIPADHPSGTFWYHAHRHGSTATQVASGTSGFLIVQGERPYTPPTPQNLHPIADIDTILHDATGQPLTEQLFLFQQIAYACFQNDPGQGPWQQLITTQGLYTVNTPGNSPINTAPWVCPLGKPGKPVSPGVVENFSLQLDSPTIWDTNGRFTSINGVVQPTIAIHAGEIQRWRFLHAGIHDTINLQIVRATPVAGRDLIAASALTGNREQQKSAVTAACAATTATLVPQFEIASDGLTRTQINKIYYTKDAKGAPVLQSNYLQPGYRSDILVVFPTAGNYCLLDQQAPRAERVSNGGGGGQGPSTPQLLAYIQVLPGPPTPTVDKLQAYVENALVRANPQLPA
ncbi:MAG TPA: multicopper oxidase domain-containing protein, partial [Caulobacteraceae bacterium]